MTKINASKKFILNDFPGDVRKWLSKLLDPLNRAMEQVFAALSNGLTIADNLKSQRFDQDLESGQTMLKLSYKLNEKPSAVVVGFIGTANGAAVAPYSHTWILNNGTLEVTFNGLSAVKHKLTLIALI